MKTVAFFQHYVLSFQAAPVRGVRQGQVHAQDGRLRGQTPGAVPDRSVIAFAVAAKKLKLLLPIDVHCLRLSTLLLAPSRETLLAC